MLHCFCWCNRHLEVAFVNVSVGFLVGKVAVRQAFVQVVRFSLVTTILPVLCPHSSFVYHQFCIILAMDCH